MSWLSPDAAWWLLLLPALLALYLFRPRSVRKAVPSLRLWEKLPQVDRPRARLRRPPLSLLLLLQLLLLTAGAVALARPAIETPVGKHYVILLDASGSMSAASSSGTRVELAKIEARKVVSAMSSQDSATLLRVGPSVTTACSRCERSDLERALTNLKAGAGQADMDAALSLASGLAGSAPDGSIETVVISDGGFRTPEGANLKSKAQNIKFVLVGSPEDNRAITVLSARRPPDGSPGSAAYARVDNTGAAAATVRVTSLADTVPLPDRTVTLAPGGHADLTWQLPGGTVRFTVSLDGRDAIRADDNAVLFLPGIARQRVAIVSLQGDLYRRALSGIGGIEPVVVSSTEKLIAEQSSAFTIIEGRVPAALPAGSLLLVNPTGDLFPKKGEITDIRPLTRGSSHPIMAGLDLSPLLVHTAQQGDLPAWLEPIVLSDAGMPLLAAGELEGRRVVALLFDPNSSNLPKLAAFPLLMANIVDWLYPLASAGALHPGDHIYLALGTTLTTPSGQVAEASASGVFNDTEEAGIYTIKSGDPATEPPQAATQFAVNMASHNESTTDPIDHPELYNQPTAQAQAGSPRSVQSELWSPLAAFALVLVGGEWLFYCWKRGRI